MKKKIFLVIILIAILMGGIFTLTGCKSKKETNNIDQAVMDETHVVINGLEFSVTKSATFKDAHYKIVEDFKEVIHDKYVQYNYYQEDQTNLLFFRIFYYENQDFDAAIADLGLENVTLTDGKTENIEYKLYEQQRTDGGTINFYFIDRDGSTYVINFVSKYDIKDFEKKVLNSIYF